MLLFKRGIRKISSRIVIPGINTNISHNSSAKITSGKMAANNGKPRARALSLNFPLFRPDDRPHNRPVLGLDTNFRIFSEIFRRFREIFKISGNFKKMWIFRAIVTKRYVTITFSFVAISKVYVLFTSQRYYTFSKFSVLTLYYASIVHTYILYELFGINNF